MDGSKNVLCKPCLAGIIADYLNWTASCCLFTYEAQKSPRPPEENCNTRTLILPCCIKMMIICFNEAISNASQLIES